MYYKNFYAALILILAVLFTQQLLNQQKQPINSCKKISIEGNIGTGKSTFLKIINKNIDTNFNYLTEPVDEWQNVANQNINLLELMYTDPSRWGFTFQSYALFTQFRKWVTLDKTSSLFIQERSLQSNKNIFALNSFENKMMTPQEWVIYNQYYEYYIQQDQLDAIIYLRASPETCLKRCQKRSRNAESSIDLNYLKQIHEKHENWLRNINIPILIINTDQDFETDNQQQQIITIQVQQFLQDIGIQ